MSNAITALRTEIMLKTAMGASVMASLVDPTVVEVMVNPDGAIWTDRHGEGRIHTGAMMTPAEAERVIRVVASHIGQEATKECPVVSAELPTVSLFKGERFEGVLPPVSTAPCFAIRKSAARIFTLDDYVDAEIMTASRRALLKEAVANRRNILIVGGTGSGKTTLANALLHEIAATGDRVVILEDTRELQCAAVDQVSLRTRPPYISMADLVKSTLRLRPDRIIVGEVRGPEALDMLKAWNTGHPGGVATIHANSAKDGLFRLEQLIGEVAATIPRAFIASAIDLLVFISGRGPQRRVGPINEVLSARGADDYDAPEITDAALKVVPLNTHNQPSETCHETEKLHQGRYYSGRLFCPCGTSARRGFRNALGSAPRSDPSIDRGAGREDHRHARDHHYRADARLRRFRRRFPKTHPDCFRPFHRLYRNELLSLVLLLRRRGGHLMTEGYSIPVHRSLTEPILLGGSPRSAAILNGTIAAALGLGLQLWVVGVLYWMIAHGACVFAAKADPKFMDVAIRHIRHAAYLS